jgi:hypothetical protein
MDRFEMGRKRRSEIREFREMRCGTIICTEATRMRTRTRTRTRTKKTLDMMMIIAASKGWQRGGIERRKGSLSLSAGCLGSVWSGDISPEGRRGTGARRWVAKTSSNEVEGYHSSMGTMIEFDL